MFWLCRSTTNIVMQDTSFNSVTLCTRNILPLLFMRKVFDSKSSRAHYVIQAKINGSKNYMASLTSCWLSSFVQSSSNCGSSLSESILLYYSIDQILAVRIFCNKLFAYYVSWLFPHPQRHYGATNYMNLLGRIRSFHAFVRSTWGPGGPGWCVDVQMCACYCGT